MPFSTATITGRRITPRGSDLLLEWSSSSPAGTWFQVYANGVLVWAGTARRVVLPVPTSRTRYEVGAVNPDEASFVQTTGVNASKPGDRAVLQWTGGTFLGASIAGFNVYSGTTPGGAVSYSNRVGYVPADQGGASAGYGAGGYGGGGYGIGAGSYRWESPPLANGTWNFGVRPVDSAGVEGTAVTVAVVIAAPPKPPRNLAVSSYNAGTRVATLTFEAGA